MPQDFSEQINHKAISPVLLDFSRPKPYADFLKRLLDIVLVLATAPITVPVILLMALAIRLEGGPAFFRQDRIGRDGHVFRILKLRTMEVQADKMLADYLECNPAARNEWNHHQKLRNDPRITRVGRFLRATSLDELPQLWNVLIGDMSLVGPRPMTTDQVDIYPGTAYYALRPGITGLWQVGDRNNTSFAARAAYDTAYARTLSLVGDLAILVRTVAVVMRRTGY